MKSTCFLTQEHKTILHALDILEAMSAYTETSNQIDEADVDKILHFLRWFADAHQAKEEAILFPVLKSAASSHCRSVDHMALEHSQERTRIEDIERDLGLKNIPEFVSAASRLSSTLRNHIYKEDNILFEMADTVLNPEQDTAVFDLLDHFDTPQDKQVLEELLRDLRSLDWKYRK